MIEQSYDNWKLWVVNDGSTENIEHHIQEYLGDSRIHYIELAENKGKNFASNTAMDKALESGTDYITFLDDDDFFFEDCLEKARSVISRHPDYNWFLSACVNKDGYVTKIKRFGEIDYVRDYFFGNAVAGDATHFIKAASIGDMRYTTAIKNQNPEWFFYHLAQSEKIFAYDNPSKFVDYQPGGLTEHRIKRSLDSYRISMSICVASLRKYPFNYRIYAKMILRTVELLVSGVTRKRKNG